VTVTAGQEGGLAPTITDEDLRKLVEQGEREEAVRWADSYLADLAELEAWQARRDEVGMRRNQIIERAIWEARDFRRIARRSTTGRSPSPRSCPRSRSPAPRRSMIWLPAKPKSELPVQVHVVEEAALIGAQHLK
jgi:hypothetical protein